MATLTTTRTTDPMPPRKIRFAPLPDPRRAVLVDDNGDELPLPDQAQLPANVLEDNYSSSSSSSHASLSPGSDQDKYSPASSVGSSPVATTTTLPAKSTSPPPQSPPAQSTSWLLRPFKRSAVSSSGSSSHSLTPTPSISQPQPQRKPLSISPEEILTLGTINLFRTSSHDSTDTNSGWSLARWANSGGGSTNSSRSTLYNGSSPLARSQSNQSSKSKSLFSTSSSSVSSGDNGKVKAKASTSKPPFKPTNRHKGVRMLNGRVYGAPKRNPNFFASAPDEEPEFVEWGYGGMGSVKGAKSAGVGASGGVNWERLHGGSAVKDGKRVAADAEEEDDGSGMAWLRKRREERERKAKEEKEKAEKEKHKVETIEGERDEGHQNPPTPTRSSMLTELSVISSAPTNVEPSPLEIVNEPEEIKNPEPSPLEAPSTTDSPTHILEAVTIPIRPRHSRTHSLPKITPLVSPGTMSGGMASPDAADSSPGIPLSTRAPSTATLTPANIDVDTTKSPVTSTQKRDSSSSFSSASSASSDDDDDGDGDESDDEDEDEDDEEAKKRMTSLGAGIEKISRHKE